MNKIIILGSGGHARSCLDVIKMGKKFSFYAFVDNFEKESSKILSEKNLAEIRKKIKYALIGVGQIKSHLPRLKIFNNLKKLNYILPIIKSPIAYISKEATIGEGSILLHRAIINSGAKIGKNTIINTGAIIEHDVTIGNNCHISTGVIINGGCKISDNTFIGSNSVVANNININKLKFIKAHSLIKKNK